MNLTMNQLSYLEYLQSRQGKDEGPIVLTHVYGPNKNTLNAMEKKGILKVLNRSTWKKTSEAHVQLEDVWKLQAQSNLSVPLGLSVQELSTLKVAIKDVGLYYRLTIRNRQESTPVLSTRDVEKKLKLTAELSKKINDL